MEVDREYPKLSFPASPSPLVCKNPWLGLVLELPLEENWASYMFAPL